MRESSIPSIGGMCRLAVAATAAARDSRPYHCDLGKRRRGTRGPTIVTLGKGGEGTRGPTIVTLEQGGEGTRRPTIVTLGKGGEGLAALPL